jgi:hypothetical protein
MVRVRNCSAVTTCLLYFLKEKIFLVSYTVMETGRHMHMHILLLNVH